MSNFRQNDIDIKCYEIKFLGEGSIDAGGPFRESLTNIASELQSDVLPLLIKSPNNKNEHGINRDCFILDGRSSTPAHKLMFRFLGAFLTYCFMTKSPIPLTLAPWVWKQLLGDEVTLADLEGIDAYSAQVLRDLQNHASSLSDEDFAAGVDQNFTTVLSSGVEVPLCPDGENIRVTKANLDDFISKTVEARKNEAAEQVAAIREGIRKVTTDYAGPRAIFTFCDWETMEVRCTGDKTVDMEKLKKISEFN